MFNKDNNKKVVVMIAVIAIIVIFIVIKVFDKRYNESNAQEINLSKIIDESPDTESNETIKVYITGEVNNQGVFELEEGSRIIDVIEKAGGQTDQADIKNVNLAYELEDGQKIYIPSVNDNNIEDIEVIDDGADGVVLDEGSSENLVNINKATVEELQNLPGIGEGLAGAIVKYREENGNFKAIEDLKSVPGIGESKFENIKELIRI